MKQSTQPISQQQHLRLCEAGGWLTIKSKENQDVAALRASHRRGWWRPLFTLSLLALGGAIAYALFVALSAVW